ncbi:MAG TPA: multicopper oxidase family protein, partial [Micromonosporaceae bacterium]|nr:multicopper oxidase family protein [Micromonosporaceae bacterium]
GRPATPRVDPARVAATEARRRRPGAPVRTVPLRAAPARLDLGGPVVDTWAYGGRLPGRAIRVTAGEILRVEFANDLPEPTSVHWHGLAIRNDMDGVPGVTQPYVQPGGRFSYEFTVPDPGTYWLHPHAGTQLDRGLYAPLVVDDPAEPGGYDLDEVVVLDDWLDGVAGRTPDATLAALRRSGSTMMGGGGGMMGGGGMVGGRGVSALLGGPGGHVEYPYHLADGRLAANPRTIAGRPGQRLRLRLVNAASDTAYRVALGGHRFTVTHADGFPVRPVDAGAVLLAMGERLDLLVTLGDGVFPLVAAAEGKSGAAAVVVRTGSGTVPQLGVSPVELGGPVLTGADLAAADRVRLGTARVARTLAVRLGGGMHDFRWTINGRTADHAEPLTVREGELVALDVVNQTMMFHPVHLHGHTFQVGPPGGTRKDTVLVRPAGRMRVVLRADNPGVWMLHCHNAYHAEAGMMTTLAYA